MGKKTHEGEWERERDSRVCLETENLVFGIRGDFMRAITRNKSSPIITTDRENINDYTSNDIIALIAIIDLYILGSFTAQTIAVNFCLGVNIFVQIAVWFYP